MLYKPSYSSWFPIQQDNYLWEMRHIFHAACYVMDTALLDASKFVTESIDLNSLYTPQPHLYLNELIDINQLATEQLIAGLESDPEFIVFKVGNLYVNREGNHRLFVLRCRGVQRITARTYRWEAA